MSRVFITGMGAVTAAGPDTAALGAALRAGRSCIEPIRLFPVGDLETRIAGEVRELPAPRLRPHGIQRASRSDLLALAATAEAWEDAGLAPGQIVPRRFGLALGSSTGGMLETESYYDARRRGDSTRALRSGLRSTSVGAAADLVAAAVSARGRRLAPSTACSSSALAIAMGRLWILQGAADIVLAGGTDALCRMTFSGFHSLKAMSPEPCRPFDRNRRGLSLGEGAGMVVLESEAHATRRGARPLAEVIGAGISCDAAHPTAPHEASRGAIAALGGALRDAGLEPAAIDYINAHGTGTPQNDVAEARAIRSVLGQAAASCPVSSTKGVIGHLLGAAGAVEAILSVLAMREHFLPPQVGLADVDPECDLAFVREVRGASLTHVVSNSYGFGGNNVSLVLRAA
ncbi:MAG: beta-ketoacyl-[acyl-carrier-protein] synthase family protein [bacterium]